MGGSPAGGKRLLGRVVGALASALARFRISFDRGARN
jgi:hypothetical protein